MAEALFAVGNTLRRKSMKTNSYNDVTVTVVNTDSQLYTLSVVRLATDPGNQPKTMSFADVHSLFIKI